MATNPHQDTPRSLGTRLSQPYCCLVKQYQKFSFMSMCKCAVMDSTTSSSNSNCLPFVITVTLRESQKSHGSRGAGPVSKAAEDAHGVFMSLPFCWLAPGSSIHVVFHHNP